MTAHQQLKETAEMVADGMAIDWAARRANCNADERATLDRLAILDQVQQAMRQPVTGIDPIESIQSWGHLRILERLGRGASSVVFRAHDPTLNREVALKLRSGVQWPRTDHATWIEEARRLARVRHPNVVAVHGADVHDGISGLWCDRVEGSTLGAHTADSPPPAMETLDVAAALLSAAAAVHRAGLVHGDIKPDNVMREDDGRLLLMDFGAAARFNKNADIIDRAGTPLAMAPERFQQARLTPAADVFGIGVVLFHWLEGRFPVDGNSAAEIQQRWAQGVQPAFKRACRPRAMRRLVLQMLAAEPADRPTVDEAIARVASMRRAPARRLRIGAALSVIAGLSIALIIALTSLQSAQRAQRETAAVNDFLSDVLSSPRRTRLGPNLPLDALLDDSVARAQHRLRDQPAALARALGTIGTSLAKLQKYDQAAPLLQQAERLLLELNHPVAAAEVRLERAGLAMDQNRFDASRRLYRQNLSNIAQGDARAAAVRVRSQIGLGHVERAAYELARARSALNQALEMLAVDRPVADRDSLRAVTLLALGQLDLDNGRFSEALDALTQARAFFEETQGPRDNNTLLARSGMVEALDRLGRLNQAAELAEKNVAITIDWLGPSDRLSIMARDALANIYSRLGAPERALEFNQAGLDALAEAPPQEPLLVLQLEANRVGYLLDAGHSKAALELSERLIPRLTESLSANHTLALITGLNKAEALLDENRPQEAHDIAQAMDQQIRELIGAGHLFAHVAGYLIGASLSALGDFDQAELSLRTHQVALSEMLGADHAIALKAAYLLILHYERTGQTATAAALARKNHAAAVAALGQDHVRTRELTLLLQRL